MKFIACFLLFSFLLFSILYRAAPSVSVAAPLSAEPTPPQVEHVGTIPLDGDYDWSAVIQDYAIFHADNNNGLELYNLQEPANPIFAGVVATDVITGIVTAHLAHNGHLYLATYPANTLYDLDMSDPTAPTLADSYLLQPQIQLNTIVANGEWLYAAYQRPGTGKVLYGIAAIHPTEGITYSPTIAGTSCTTLAVQGENLVFGCGEESGDVTLYQRDNPAQPTKVAEFGIGNAVCDSLWLESPYIFYQDTVYRINEGSLPTEVNTIPTPPNNYIGQFAEWDGYLLRVGYSILEEPQSDLVPLENPATAQPLPDPFLLETLDCGQDVQTEGEWLYTVTGEAFTAAGFAIYRLNGGYTQTYAPLTLANSNETLNNYQGLLLHIDQNGHNLVTMRADGTERRAITSLQDEAISHTLWSPQNDLVALSTAYTNTLRIAALDGSGDSIVYTSTEDIEPLAWSPDQRRLAFRTYSTFSENGTYLLDTTDNSVTALEGFVSPPISWSPDGKTLLYHRDLGQNLGNTIWVADADGGNPRRLTIADNGIVFLRWVSNGAQFLARKREEGNTGQVIYLYNSDGTRERELIRISAYSDPFTLTLAPNRIAVTYQLDEPGYFTRMYVQYEGSDPLPLSDALCDRDNEPYCGVSAARWSPTSQQVAYNTGDADPATPYDSQLWVVPLTPTPTIPTMPVAQNLGVHAWLNNNFLMVIEATISPDPRAVGVLHPQSGTYERLSPSDGAYWDNIEWRPVP